jgi:flagellar hook-associated protein 3 FlgL
MTRVSENSQTAAFQYSLNKAKSKLEDLQLKGASLKKITKPSDNPIGNVEALSINTRKTENDQYVRNIDFAQMHLSIADKSVEELIEILSKAKEIAIAQSSDFYDKGIRKNVSNEIIQLKNLALSIGNKRIGNKYIFSGFKSLTQPFDEHGRYSGDKGEIKIEVAKDFFIPININGEQIFFAEDVGKSNEVKMPLMPGDSSTEEEPGQNRQPAATAPGTPSPETAFQKRENIFSLLNGLIVGLESNDPKLIQSLLEKFDEATTRLISLRTKVGSVMNTIEVTKAKIDSENLDSVARKSKLVDADVTELFTDLTRQQAVLDTTYKSSKTLLNQSLIDFLR